MAGRGQVHQPGARLHQRGDPVDQHEVAQVIGAELGLEAVRRLAERRRHDAGVGDDQVERLAGRDQGVGAGAYAGQGRQVELRQLQPAAVRGLGADLGRGGLRLLQVARRADDLGAMGGEGASRLDAEARGHAGHQDALAAQVDARQHVVGGGGGSKGSGHGELRCCWLGDEGPVSVKCAARCQGCAADINGGGLRSIYGGVLRLSRDRRS